MKKKQKNNYKLFKAYFNRIINFIKKYKYVIFMAFPFILPDIILRAFILQNKFTSPFYFVPNMFTAVWIILFIGISLSFKDKYRNIIYISLVSVSSILFLTNGVYYFMTNSFFDFTLLQSVSEGSPYIFDALKKADIWVYILFILNIVYAIYILKFIPKQRKNKYNVLGIVLLLFLLLHSITPLFYGKANSELTWNTWKNKKNVYINFNDNNKSMSISGLYEYSVRNFYITFIKEEVTDSEIELNFLSEIFDEIEQENTNNSYTGNFKDKNLIFLQLEGIDNWILNKETTPNLYAMLNNAYNFTNHFSFYNGGGSTFNSEFAVNTGYITPISYTQNAYTFNKNNFPYSMARLFKELDYVVNAYHMNTTEYYSRGINYKTWGFDNYYGLMDQSYYKDNTYMLDTELINNPIFYDLMFKGEKKFVNYLITYSVHMPFNSSKGMCKMILNKDKNKEELSTIESTMEPLYTEEECVRIQAKETDDMVGLLLQALKDNGLYDNTAIVAFADHYLYTISDSTILDKYKDTSNNMINNTPFFIWSSDIKKKKTIKNVTSQLNILPTILNLYGIDYNSTYYVGKDALDNNYDGIAFFSDFSWYDGNAYVDGGLITNGASMSAETLEEKNSYVDYLIKKNDLVLKHNYFEKIKKNKN